MSRTNEDGKGAKVFETLKRFPTLVAMGLIQLYKALISPLLPSSCRFVPTCSEYGLQAFKRFGFIQGMKLTAKRILKCRPGGPYGYDPVPDEIPERKAGFRREN